MLNIFVKLSTFDSHNQQKQNNQILHHHISKMRNSHIRIDSYVYFVEVLDNDSSVSDNLGIESKHKRL